MNEEGFPQREALCFYVSMSNDSKSNEKRIPKLQLMKEEKNNVRKC